MISESYSPLIELSPLLMISGILAGLLAGLLGVGGGVIMVPLFFFVFHHLGMDASNAMKLATGTSLMGMIPTALSSALAHYKNGNVSIELVKTWSVWILIGVFIGLFLLTQYSSNLFILLFALMMGWVSYRMFFSSTIQTQQTLPQTFQYGIASGIGGLSVMMGVGGGTLSVPALHKLGYSMHHAIGTASVFGLMIALPGAVTMLLIATTPEQSLFGTYGAVNWFSLLFIVPLTIVFAPIGVKHGTKLNTKILKKIFAVVLLITSLRMLSQAF